MAPLLSDHEVIFINRIVYQLVPSLTNYRL
jgi:hypothetical protein